MKKKLAKVAILAALSCLLMQAFVACTDDNSSGAEGLYSKRSSSSFSMNSAGSTAFNGTWYYYIASNDVDIKWGASPDVAAIDCDNNIGVTYLVDQQVLVRCNGVCGKVTLKPAHHAWNAFVLHYVLEPDNWQTGNNFLTLSGICLKYKIIYEGDFVDYVNDLQGMRINLEVADEISSSREVNTKFRYTIDENLITENKGEVRVVNIAWSDFVYPVSDRYYANEPYTLVDAVSHLHGIQIAFVQYSEFEVMEYFKIEKIGAYGTCED